MTSGGIASVSNFGTFGLDWGTPIPLPDQTLLLGLGAGKKSPTWDEEKQQFVPVTQAELTLSFDHRSLDGGGAGRLLKANRRAAWRSGEIVVRTDVLADRARPFSTEWILRSTIDPNITMRDCSSSFPARSVHSSANITSAVAAVADSVPTKRSLEFAHAMKI